MRRSAFTVIELIVVAVIVAVAAVVTLKIVTAVGRTARGVGCTSNLQQVLQALTAYTTDHNGCMPYGWYYTHSDPVTWDEVPGGDGSYISWFSVLNPYLGTEPSVPAPAFKCPEAQAQFEHRYSYVMNWIVAISPYYELLIGNPPNAQLRPPHVDMMLPEGTALVWDTAVQPDWNVEDGFFTGADIDGQRFWEGAGIPQYRYFNRADPFGHLPPPAPYGNNKPVVVNVGSNAWRNIDPPANTNFPFQGNLRFRHGSRNTCNVAFSDGTVRQFTATIRPDLTLQTHNALRRYFMIKWPDGVTPDPNYPYGPSPPVRDPVRPPKRY